MIKKANLQNMDMGLSTAPTVKPTDPDNLDRGLANFIRTGKVEKQGEPSSAKTYRLPDKYIKAMERERYEASMKGEKTTLTDIIVECLKKRYPEV